MFGISAIVGPLLGGFLTEQFSWHLIFYINIPIGIVALAVIGRLLPTVKRPDAIAQPRLPRARPCSRSPSARC